MVSIHALEEGVVYKVTKSFTDHYQNHFATGTKLTYAGRAFLPYHGGHTLFFKEQSIYLQEDEDAALIGSLHEYLTPFDVTGRVSPAQCPPAPPALARRKRFYYFLGFFALALLSLLITLFGLPRHVWLPVVPPGIGFLPLIGAVIAEWGQPG